MSILRITVLVMLAAMNISQVFVIRRQAAVLVECTESMNELIAADERLKQADAELKANAAKLMEAGARLREANEQLRKSHAALLTALQGIFAAGGSSVRYCPTCSDLIVGRPE